MAGTLVSQYWCSHTNLKLSRDGNKHYFNTPTNHWTENLQNGHLAVAHKTKMLQFLHVTLNLKWQGPHCATEIAHGLEISRLPELDGAEHVGCINSTGYNKFSTPSNGVQSAQGIPTPNIPQVKESEEFKELMGEAVA